MRVYIKFRNFLFSLTLTVSISIVIYLIYTNHIETKREYHEKCPNLKENNKWVINNKIVQYSSYLIKLDNNKFHIEALIIHSTSTPINKNMKCLIRYYQNGFLITPITNTVHITTSSDYGIIYQTKIICDLPNDNLKNINIAVIDSNDFERIDQVIFQTPTFIDATLPKLQQVAHCGHMVRGINRESFYTWIKLQRMIGINRMKFYSIDKSTPIDQFDTNIEIIDYDVDFSKVCGDCPSRNSACELIYDMYFKRIHHPQTLRLHEKLQANDCYLSLKYNYEFITNYDLDEIIYPRGPSKPSAQLDCDKINCNESNNMSIYNYAVGLFENRQKITSLTFENVHFFKLNRFFHTFFSSIDITNIPADDTQRFIPLLIDDTNKQLEYLKFIYQPEDLDSLSMLLKQYNSTKCLITEDKSNQFDRLMYAKLDIKTGGSILSTKYIEQLKSATLPIENGFIGHFRDEPFSYFQSSTLHVSSIGFDLDYYLFFLKNFYISFCKVY
jgi:hypothetical protein